MFDRAYQSFAKVILRGTTAICIRNTMGGIQPKF
jgi:hypothetical protein